MVGRHQMKMGSSCGLVVRRMFVRVDTLKESNAFLIYKRI